MSKIMHVVKNFVYWASLVGPLYSLVVGTVKGFIGAVQSIREDEKLKLEQARFNNLPTEFIDLSNTNEAKVFTQVCDVVGNLEDK